MQHPKIAPCGAEGPTPACVKTCDNGAGWTASKHHGQAPYSLDMSTIYQASLARGHSHLCTLLNRVLRQECGMCSSWALLSITLVPLCITSVGNPLVGMVLQELMTHGPVESSFTVYADFPSYTGGVYVQTSDQELGGHAIKIMGESRVSLRVRQAVAPCSVLYRTVHTAPRCTALCAVPRTPLAPPPLKVFPCRFLYEIP